MSANQNPLSDHLGIEAAVRALLEKATREHDSANAMRFTQAALNAAHLKQALIVNKPLPPLNAK